MNSTVTPLITVFQTNNIHEVNGLKEKFYELEKLTKIKTQKDEISAFAGDWAGSLIGFLLSEPVQAIITLTEIGAILIGIITLCKKAGKTYCYGMMV